MNDLLFFKCFRNKFIKNQIFYYLKIFNQYNEQKEIIFDENNQWIDYSNLEYYKSIKFKFINHKNVYKILNLLEKISNSNNNIEWIEFDELRELKTEQYKQLFNLVLKNGHKISKIKFTNFPDIITNSSLNLIPSNLLIQILIIDTKYFNLPTIIQNQSITELDLSNCKQQFLIQDYHLSKLINLKKLYLSNQFNQFILPNSLPNNLIKLKFGLNFNQVFNQVDQLPPNLESLEFSYNYNQKLNFKYFPFNNLKKLKFGNFNLLNNKFKNVKLLSNLSTLVINNISNNSKLISNNNNIKFPVSLTKLSISNEFDFKFLIKSILILKNLKKLNLESTHNSKLFLNSLISTPSSSSSSSSSLPIHLSTLKSLKLKSNTQLPLTNIPNSIKTLKKLKLIYNNFNDHLIDSISLPSNITTLKLAISQPITPMLQLSNNLNLKILKFSNYFSNEIQKDSLPNSLTSLEINDNFKFTFSNYQSILKFSIPTNLKYLKIGKCIENNSISLNQFFALLPQKLKIFQINLDYYYDNNNINDIINNSSILFIPLDQLPKSIEILILNGNKTLFKLPQSISLPSLHSIYVDSLSTQSFIHIKLSSSSSPSSSPSSSSPHHFIKPISHLKLKKLFNKFIKK